MSRLLGLILISSLALGALGCDGDETTTTTTEPTTSSGPPIGSTAWGADECLYTYVGGERYEPAELCRRQQADGSVAYFNRSEPTRTTFVESGGYLYYSYEGLPARQPIGSRDPTTVQVEYGGRWMSSTEYATLRAQEEQVASEEEQRQLAEQQRLELEQQFQETQDRVIERILAPECNSSYNGCG